MSDDLIYRLTIWADTRDEENGEEPDAGKNIRTGWLREAVASLSRVDAHQHEITKLRERVAILNREHGKHYPDESLL
jgi:hypothetical protein